MLNPKYNFKQYMLLLRFPIHGNFYPFSAPLNRMFFSWIDKKALRQACLWNVSGFSAKPATVFPAVRIPADENLVLFRRGVHDCRVRAEGAVLKPL